MNIKESIWGEKSVLLLTGGGGNDLGILGQRRENVSYDWKHMAAVSQPCWFVLLDRSEQKEKQQRFVGLENCCEASFIYNIMYNLNHFMIVVKVNMIK